MNVYDFTIKGRVPSKKNSKIWTGKYLITSKAYSLWQRYSEKYLKNVKNLNLENVEILMDFYMPDKRKADIDNKMSSVLDLLSHYKVIKDDSWQCVRRIAAQVDENYPIDKENPRVEVTIIKI